MESRESSIFDAKIFVLKASSLLRGTSKETEFLKEIEELKKTTDTLMELGEDWKENMAIINIAVQGNGAMLELIKRLSKESDQGNLIKIGLTLIAFPFPIVIDDVLGWSLLAAGLIQRKIKNSALYLEDVNRIFPSILRELHEIRQEAI